MKFSTGWAALAALFFAVPAANGQGAPNGAGAPYTAASDFDGPYAAMPPEAPAARYGYGPSLLPATEVYTVLRENGFSPLGIPRLRGTVYTIAVIDRRGDDGRLVIDARDGRIVRFLPARGIGPAFDDNARAPYGPQGALPPPTVGRAAPRPPAPVPHVASRSVPVPKPSPLAPKPAPAAAVAVTPAQQATVAPVAAAQPKPAEAQATAQAASPTVGQAPSPATPAASAILPTQEMPNVQALE